jgi:glycosyltransferase involved in cell wall biosynthesis
MRIVLISSFAPFVNGGARFIVEWLQTKLVEHGHEVERFYLPFVERDNLLAEQYLAYRMLEVGDKADVLVAFRPPAYAVRHPRKIVWFIHHIRAFYDLAGTDHQGFEDTPKGRAFQQTLIEMDNVTLREARRVYTNSNVVASRLARFNGVEAETLYPPLLLPERFRHESYGDEIVAVCRVEAHKRQRLLIDAMRHTKTQVKLRICGVSGSQRYSQELMHAIRTSGAADRIVFDNRWISEEEKSEYLASALAVAYLPLDEDSYGYPTLEGAHAKKPIVTTADSGGVLEFVEDRRNGFVVDSQPAAIARAFDELYTDRQLTQRLGDGSHQRLGELRIDWDHVVERILS